MTTASSVVIGMMVAGMLWGCSSGPGEPSGSAGRLSIPQPGSAALRTSSVSQATSGGGLVVAYFPLDIASSYSPSQIDFTVVTHVVEHAVCTDANGNLNLNALGKEFPVPNLVSTAHANGAQALLGLCADAGTDVFGAMAASPTAVTNYVHNVTALVAQYDFDGIDIDWEYPASTTDEANLTNLVSALRTALGSSATFSIVGPPTPGYGQYYDFPAIMPSLNWFASMTYNYQGPGSSTKALPASPLVATSGWWTERSVSYFLGQGVPANQLLIGLPFFGTQYDGANAIGQTLTNNNGSQEVAYSSVVPLIGDGWTYYFDSAASEAYLLMTNGSDGVLTFDDPTAVGDKCSYVVSQGLGGAIIWNLGQDVVGGTQPLLSAASGCR